MKFRVLVTSKCVFLDELLGAWAIFGCAMVGTGAATIVCTPCKKSRNVGAKSWRKDVFAAELSYPGNPMTVYVVERILVARCSLSRTSCASIAVDHLLKA